MVKSLIGLLKRLKNTEGKNEQQLEAMEDRKERQLELISKNNLAGRPEKLEIKDLENLKAKELINEANTIIDKNKNKRFLHINSNGTPYDFN